MSFTAREVARSVHAYTAGTSRHPGVGGTSLNSVLEGVQAGLVNARRRYAAAVGTPRVLLVEPDDELLRRWDAEAAAELDYVAARLAAVQR